MWTVLFNLFHFDFTISNGVRFFYVSVPYRHFLYNINFFMNNFNSKLLHEKSDIVHAFIILPVTTIVLHLSIISSAMTLLNVVTIERADCNISRGKYHSCKYLTTSLRVGFFHYVTKSSRVGLVVTQLKKFTYDFQFKKMSDLSQYLMAYKASMFTITITFNCGEWEESKFSKLNLVVVGADS